MSSSSENEQVVLETIIR